MSISKYTMNDDSKVALLKASYTLGVFEGSDKAFQEITKLFTDESSLMTPR